MRIRRELKSKLRRKESSGIRRKPLRNERGLQIGKLVISTSLWKIRSSIRRRGTRN
jgi:hypothetical protein